MTDLKKAKKEFAKVIGTIRKERNEEINLPNCSFPKPMMTIKQMEQNTATVNCGGEFSSLETTTERSELVMNDERFKEFLKKHNATAKIELNQFGTKQIRINF